MPAFFPSPPGFSPPTLSSSYDSIFTFFQLSHHLSSQARDTGCGSLSYLLFLSLWLGKTSLWALRAISVHGILSCSDSEWATLRLFTSVSLQASSGPGMWCGRHGLDVTLLGGCFVLGVVEGSRNKLPYVISQVTPSTSTRRKVLVSTLQNEKTEAQTPLVTCLRS